MASAEALADQVSEPDWPVWVLTSPDGVLLGVTTADETPALGWTEQERDEPATFLQSTVTHLAKAGLALVRYYRRQGWQVVRTLVSRTSQSGRLPEPSLYSPISATW